MSETGTPADERAVDVAPEDALRPEEEAAVERVPWWQRFVTGSTTSIGLILVALIVVFSVLEYHELRLGLERAQHRHRRRRAARAQATGMTYVIITAGIDLSVGAVAVFSGVVSVKAMNAVGGDNWGDDRRRARGRARGGLRLGRRERLPGRQGEDPAAHRHARDARHVARRRAADHRRRRRARRALQARRHDRQRAPVRPRCRTS